MLIGHYGPALVVQRAYPRLPLWALFVAVQAVDIGWAVLVLAGVERAHLEVGFTASNDLVLDSVPWTHSLVATALWALAVALLWWLWQRRRRPGVATAAAALGLAVASHWLMDLPVHVPDLPLAGDGSLRVGLGLWRNRPLAFLLELSVFASSWWMWARGRPLDWRAKTLLAVGVILNFATYFGPAPQQIGLLCLTTLVVYAVMAALAVWVGQGERQRNLE